MNKKYFVNVRFPEDLYNKLHKSGRKTSVIVRNAVETWLEYYKLDNKKIHFKTDENYIILGKTGSGKTKLLKSLLSVITGRKIIIDPKAEYVDVGNVKKIVQTGDIPFAAADEKAAIKVWAQTEARKLRDEIDAAKETNFVIQPAISKLEIEHIFIREFLQTMLQSHLMGNENHDILIIEDASRYKDVLQPIVSQGRHKNLQVIIVSQLPLPDDIITNTSPILGHMWTDILRDTALPSFISETSKTLGHDTWLWFDSSSKTWNRYAPNEPMAQTKKVISQNIKSEEKIENVTQKIAVSERTTKKVEKRNNIQKSQIAPQETQSSS